MALGVLATLLCLLGVTLLPTVSGITVCKGYWDTSGDYHDVQQCGYSYSGSNYFCCGDCNKRYCCSDANHRLSEKEQDRCPQYGLSPQSSVRRTSKIPIIIGTVVGSILPFIICVGLIICCMCPCCFLYKRFRRNRSRNSVINATTHTTLVPIPQQPPASPGQPQSYQGGHCPVYQSMPLQPGYGIQPMMPQGHGSTMPSAPPPSYTMEVGGPGYSSPSGPYSHAAFSEGQAMYPLQPPTQPSAPTPYSDDRAIPPSYNPSY